MTNRYEILDILSQDGSGVSFHATDRETGREVVLRRFFPFGPDGGGLEDEEKKAYEAGVKRLQGISHPALRTVIDGGSDPVDGMPFLVTEWLEGEMLSQRLHDGSLSSESVRTLADLALETSQVLSEIFGEDAIWVETDPRTIIISDEDPDRPITFWICPIRWLGDSSARSNLKPLLEMVEELMGWRGQMISRNSGGGLGAWVKTLRDEPNVWNLAQARAALHEPATIVEASAAQGAAAPAMNPPPPQQVVFVNRPVVWPWVLASLLALSVAGILGWKHFTPPAGTAPVVAENPPPAQAPAAAPAEPESSSSDQEVDAGSKAPAVASTPAPSAKPAPAAESAVEAMNRRAAEMAAKAEANALITLGEKATVEGTIAAIETSRTGKTKYIRFTTTEGNQTLWAMFRLSDWEDFDLSTLDGLAGRHARFSGRWTSENSPRKFLLRMTAPRQLEVLD
ncbi:hypothetical protein ACFQY0_14495 [Haloferula chungangensis]|uniref:Protein kinase domain-containing protein n=1 Tax=Haloferula chungangensis TaxID=1048331 RepID=A0ABW2LB65_9BACT